MADLIQIEDPNDPGQLKPLLRPLEVTGVDEEGEEMIILSDPMHLLEDSVVLPAAYLPLLELLDGSRTVNELAGQLVKETGELESGQFIRNLVRTLDERLLLDSPRFREAWEKYAEEYQALPSRPAALAGLSYPDEPDQLRLFLSGLKGQAEEFQIGPLPMEEAGTADTLIVPHIDLRRGGATMALAYREWEKSAPRIILSGGGERPAQIVVAFGTGHSVLGSLVALTRKDFETPLGTVPSCKGVIDSLARRLGQGAFAEEIAHREEHSLEFQAVFLADLMERGARFEMVPILGGSFHPFLAMKEKPSEEPIVEEFAVALREALKEVGRPVKFLAGVDFSHVGPRFGDKWEMNEDSLAALQEQDLAVIDAALTGDPDLWFDAIAAQNDSTHICGFSSVYLMLRTLGGAKGRLLRYEQSPEQESGSVVTYASIAFESVGASRQ